MPFAMAPSAGMRRLGCHQIFGLVNAMLGDTVLVHVLDRQRILVIHLTH